MATEVSICNIALMRCGVSFSISAIDEGSQEANACNVFFAHCRDVTLQGAPWGFAKRRATLALSSTAAPTGWAYAYAMPTDCLTPREVINPSVPRNARNDQRVPFAVGGTGSQRLIFCDLEDAELEYTARVTNAAQFDPLFADAVAWMLAAEIAAPLSASGDIISMARKMHAQAMHAAITRALSEGCEGPEPESELIAARY